jgi:hypothetical protein
MTDPRPVFWRPEDPNRSLLEAKIAKEAEIARQSDPTRWGPRRTYQETSSNVPTSASMSTSRPSSNSPSGGATMGHFEYGMNDAKQQHPWSSAGGANGPFGGNGGHPGSTGRMRRGDEGRNEGIGPDREGRDPPVEGSALPNYIYHSISPKPKRQPISCYPCRKRKLKCDGDHPCSSCIKRSSEVECKYEGEIKRRGKGKKQVEADIADAEHGLGLGLVPVPHGSAGSGGSRTDVGESSRGSGRGHGHDQADEGESPIRRTAGDSPEGALDHPVHTRHYGFDSRHAGADTRMDAKNALLLQDHVHERPERRQGESSVFNGHDKFLRDHRQAALDRAARPQSSHDPDIDMAEARPRLFSYSKHEWSDQRPNHPRSQLRSPPVAFGSTSSIEPSHLRTETESGRTSTSAHVSPRQSSASLISVGATSTETNGETLSRATTPKSPADLRVLIDATAQVAKLNMTPRLP